MGRFESHLLVDRVDEDKKVLPVDPPRLLEVLWRQVVLFYIYPGGCPQ